MSKQIDILEESLSLAEAKGSNSFIADDELRQKIEFVCRCIANKAPIRFLMSCLLAKIDNPKVDIRKPYTEIGGDDTYSGRFYDEKYVQGFVLKHKLPCNSTTAYLTPAFRNIDRVLTTDLVLVGRPREAYTFTLEVLNSIFKESEKPENILTEILRFLLIIKREDDTRISQLIAGLKHSSDFLPLSSEEIITLLVQHLSSKNASRLPVLIVAAAYQSVKDRFGETILPLQSHNAADKQTGSIGDVEVTLANDDNVITCYEMKDKRVTKNDIDQAIIKFTNYKHKIDNYIFITTDTIEPEYVDYAKSLYEQTGIEIAILDCVGFLRHFLHFFHRQRNDFLNCYQALVLAEPTSSVSQPLKEAFLALRKAAESDRS